MHSTAEKHQNLTLFAMHSLGRTTHFFLKKQYVTYAEPLTKIIGFWYVG